MENITTYVKETISSYGKTNKNHSIIFKQSEIVSVTIARFSQLQLAELCVAVLALTGIGSSAIVSDLTYTKVYDKREEALMAQLICTASSLILILAIYWRTKQELLWEQAKGIYSVFDDMSTTGKMTIFLLEAFINIIHPPIGLLSTNFIAQDVVVENDIEYSYNTIFTAFTVIRVYHLIRFMSIYSKFRSSRSQRLCQMNGSYAGTYYAMKCMMNEQPMMIMVLMLLTGIFIFGFLLRLFERPASYLNGKDFSDYGNAMWCIITTMTTVGYGDYFPVTLPGRVIGCLACVWGVMVVSVMCVSLYNLMNLDEGQAESLLTLQRLWFKDALRDSAAFVITAVYRYRYMLKYKNRVGKKDLELQLGKVRNYVNEFQRSRNKQRSLYSYDSYNEIIQYKLGEIIGQAKQKEKTDKILKLIERLDEKVQKKISKG
ncbi:hypothetical protein SteCoe_8087 [Stentor coeruleus]|uniref:Potassium channel domain-containing protein n=1 Tax=Stentor coeruleus TaxID=5963 RepID=A0A1R2CL31_9CILI|nr:hypothetical protein SteCoe_8087 [Stentor coeruleus]